MIVGISCSSRYAFVALLEGDRVVDGEPARLGFAPSVSHAEALREFVTTTEEHFRTLRPEAIAIFKANYRPNSYSDAKSRAQLETLIELAAAQLGRTVEYLALPTIRSRLNLGRSGSAADAAEEYGIEPVGQYWNAGRAAAAVTAMTLGVGA